VQQPRLVLRLKSRTDVSDGDVDHVRDRVTFDAPHRLQELLAFEHLALVPQEVLEHVELQRGELDEALAAPDLVRGDIHDEIGAAEQLTAAWLAPAKERAHPREELVEREGLGEIVIGAGVESGDAVGDGVACGEHQDRDVRSRAQSPADFDTVDAREHHVEDNDVRWSIPRFDERVGSVSDNIHGIALVCERTPERGAKPSIVVNDKDPPPRAHARMMRDGRSMVTVTAAPRSL
jgi:hypothetical protein